jgi:xanthine dehydrogenase accessory factor
VEIYEEVLRLKKEGRPSALATIVQCLGSSPQKEGAKMLVRDDSTIMGTLGGGCLEAEVIQASRIAMRDGSPATIPFELTERSGDLVCGGKVLVFIEPIVPEPRLVILGAGHVGRALAKVAKFSGYRVIVADDRAEYANREWIADADEIVVRSFEGIFRDLPVDRNTYIVIATRGHAHDIEALKGALVTEARYIGLLGSRRKRAVIFRTLGDEGFSKEMLDCVVTPVGLPIGSITPEEIAISIVAQVIQYRRGHALSGLGDSPRCGLIQEDGTAKTASLPRQ